MANSLLYVLTTRYGKGKGCAQAHLLRSELAPKLTFLFFPAPSNNQEIWSFQAFGVLVMAVHLQQQQSPATALRLISQCVLLVAMGHLWGCRDELQTHLTSPVGGLSLGMRVGKSRKHCLAFQRKTWAHRCLRRHGQHSWALRHAAEKRGKERGERDWGDVCQRQKHLPGMRVFVCFSAARRAAPAPPPSLWSCNIHQFLFHCCLRICGAPAAAVVIHPSSTWMPSSTFTGGKSWGHWGKPKLPEHPSFALGLQAAVLERAQILAHLLLIFVKQKAWVFLGAASMWGLSSS